MRSESRGADGRDAESDRCGNSKYDEEHQKDELRDQKGRLGLRRHHHLQRRHLLESLHDQDKHIQIEGNHRGHHKHQHQQESKRRTRFSSTLILLGFLFAR